MVTPDEQRWSVGPRVDEDDDTRVGLPAAGTGGIKSPMAASTAKLVERIGSSYILALMAAKRAKQLKEGAPALVESDSNHSLTIALMEIAHDKIRPVLKPTEVEEEKDLLEEATLQDLEEAVALPPIDVRVEDDEELADTTDIGALLDEEEELDEEAGEEEGEDLSVLVDDEETAAHDEAGEDELPVLDMEDGPVPEVILEEDGEPTEDAMVLEDPEEEDSVN